MAAQWMTIWQPSIALRVALSMAGGYGRVIDDTVQVHLGTIRAAVASWQQWNNADP